MGDHRTDETIIARIRHGFWAWCVGLLAALSLAGTAAAGPLATPAIEGEYQLYDRSSALLIGVSDYEEWSSLDGVRRNVRDLERFLTNRGFAVTTLMNARAVEIRDAINAYLDEQVDARTRSIIYFAGHGWMNPQPGTRDPIGFLVAQDTPSPASIRGQAFSSFISTMRQAALSDLEIQEFARDSRARHTLFLIDSCFSGAIFGQRSGFATRIGHPLPSLTFWEQLGRPSAQYITVGNEFEKTPADSPLVDLFIRAIETGAEDPASPFVTASEVSLWLRRNLSPRGDLTPQWGWVVSSSGEMVFRTGNATRFRPPAAVEDGALSGGAVRQTSNREFRHVAVHYYRKASDGSAVLDVLNGLDIPHQVRRVSHDTPVNALGCHPDIDPELLRTLATELVRAGVGLRSIREFSNPEGKPNRFDIFTARLRGATRLLTVEDIRELDACPELLIAR